MGCPPPPKNVVSKTTALISVTFIQKKKEKKKGPPIPRENTFPYWGTQMELPSSKLPESTFIFFFLSFAFYPNVLPHSQ